MFKIPEERRNKILNINRRMKLPYIGEYVVNVNGGLYGRIEVSRTLRKFDRTMGVKEVLLDAFYVRCCGDFPFSFFGCVHFNTRIIRLKWNWKMFVK